MAYTCDYCCIRHIQVHWLLLWKRWTKFFSMLLQYFPIKPCASVCESQQWMRLGNHHHDFIMPIVSLKPARFTKPFIRSIIYSVMSYRLVVQSVAICFWQICGYFKHRGTTCKRSNYIEIATQCEGDGEYLISSKYTTSSGRRNHKLKS